MPASTAQCLPAGGLLAAGGLATTFRSIAPAEADGVLKARYGIAGTFRRLDTEKDDTFLVTTPQARFIAKFSNPDEDPREISLQSDLLDHVARTDPGLPVPRVVRTRDGAAFFSHRDDHGQARLVRVLGYLEGTPLDRIETTAAERRRVGATLARLRLATADFAHPHDGREIAWDIRHLPKLAFLLDEIGEPAHRRLLEQGLERFLALEGRLAACRTQVLHNDFSRSNVVADRAHPDFITGVIDFGDVVRTAIVIDVSTALLNQLSPDGGPDMFDAGRDLLAGYLAVADLTDEELALLPHLVMGRVLARALITTWRAAQFPDNAAYIVRNTHQGWAQLGHFLSRPADDISATFAGMNTGKPAATNREHAPS